MFGWRNKETVLSFGDDPCFLVNILSYPLVGIKHHLPLGAFVRYVYVGVFVSYFFLLVSDVLDSQFAVLANQQSIYSLHWSPR